MTQQPPADPPDHDPHDLRFFEETIKTPSRAATPAPFLGLDDPTGLIGEQVGNFEIQRLLGMGGFGIVYQALDTMLHRKAALKFLRQTDDPALRQHLLEEARLLASLNHPNIVQIYAFGEYEETLYLVLEYIRRDIYSFAETFRQGLPAAEIVRIGAECAEALSLAHSRGILHRDVKPDNILIEQMSHRAKLSDFGIAASAPQDTNDRTLSGTPAYMSPEQSQGMDLDPRTDIYSLGVTLYQLLTGKRPFEAPTVSALVPILIRGNYTPLHEHRPDLPEALCEIVHKAMATQSSRRYTTAGELSKQFRNALNTLTFEEQPALRVQPQKRKSTTILHLEEDIESPH